MTPIGKNIVLLTHTVNDEGGDRVSGGAVELDAEKIGALDSSTRRKIIELLHERPHYPSEAARKLDISKQRAHYHFKKLQESGMVQKEEGKDVSGGRTSSYELRSTHYYYKAGSNSQNLSGSLKPSVVEFFGPAVRNDRIDITVVAGSADPHGPDDVRARDGHMAGEITGKIAEFGDMSRPRVSLDTELKRDGSFRQNMLLLGGVLTNTATRRFNSEFPASFTGEEFPYRKIGAEDEDYSDPEIGVIAATENPRNDDGKLFMVAGVRNQGTRAAVVAFNDLESVVDRINTRGYVVIRGKDRDSDGVVESYEVEK